MRHHTSVQTEKQFAGWILRCSCSRRYEREGEPAKGAPKACSIQKNYHPNRAWQRRISFNMLKNKWHAALQMLPVLTSIQALVTTPRSDKPLAEEPWTPSHGNDWLLILLWWWWWWWIISKEEWERVSGLVGCPMIPGALSPRRSPRHRILNANTGKSQANRDELVNPTWCQSFKFSPPSYLSCVFSSVKIGVIQDCY